MRPASGAWAPDRIFRSVDLPAPFSPSRAWISPGPTLKPTSSSASTPGNRLLIADIRSRGSVMLGTPSSGQCGSGASETIRPRPWCGDRVVRRRWRALFQFADALRLVEVLLGDRHRRQQGQRLGLLAVAEEADEGLDRTAALAARELLDGRGQAAVADSAESFGQSVEADHHHAGDVAALEGLDGAESHVVIAADDYLRRLIHAAERRFRDRKAVRAAEVRRLLEDELV